MMASTWRQHCFLTQRLPLGLVPYLVLTLTTVFYGRGSAAHLTREVGGNVTFHCPVNRQRATDFVYLQRGEQFVNGFYDSKEKLTNTWTNTKFDRENSTVFMYNLNLNHSGTYSCHIRYKDQSEIVESTIILTVTAKYSKPTVTSVCREKNVQFCHVTCSSYSGSPKTQMIVQAVVGNTSSQIWANVVRNEVYNSSSMLFDSFSTAYYNCSSEEIKFSCSVGNVTSDEFTVCVPQRPNNTPVMAAAICIVVVVIVIVVILCCRRRAGVNGRRARVPTNDEVEIATIKEAA
ncbi:T-lymphocyte activation antigen CD86 isoform X1 [Archocentrus centrarchus]|uniref:T-lymphocyte activation antigen CD86 isoform X1 n=2 Tax=Archocentrus centrarchus TaxID=63155 RepID=UPI0011EA41F6|nr:T-lymphocyte activation antigen CD86-like isoform X1 [Archocentrus centrarchus]